MILDYTIKALQMAGYSIEYTSHGHTVRLHGQSISSAGTRRQTPYRGRAVSANREFHREQAWNAALRHYERHHKGGKV